MNFEEAVVEGWQRNLKPEYRDADLRKICEDETFPSLLGLIAEMEKDAAAFAAEVEALERGLLGRANGSLAALGELKYRLRAFYERQDAVTPATKPTSVGAN